MKSLKKAWEHIKNNKQPRYIFHPRYILPNLTGALALHRRLFFLSHKNPLHLMFNMYAYIRWVTITAWILCYKSTLKNYKQAKKSKFVLFFNLLMLALKHGIPPRYYFKYEFDQPQNKKQAFTYFYNAELPYFHDYTNQNFSHYKQAVQLIRNKQGFAEALKQIGLPVVPGKIYKTQDLRHQPFLLYAKKTHFCKPNHGSRSCDAFLMVYNANTTLYHIKPITQPDIYGDQEISHYLDQIYSKHDILLIQEFIEDHPDVQAISQQEPTTTVRIITEKSDDQAETLPKLLYLQLELPTKKQKQQFYNILPLALSSLDIDPVFILKNKNLSDEPYPAISDAIKKELKHAITLCLEAHKALLAVRSVSFDVILSKTGPIILEANYNWSIELLYNVIDMNQPASHPAAYWLENILAIK